MNVTKLLFILDDDAFYSELLAAHLQKYSLEIQLFADSKSCIENLVRNPSFLLLDFNLNEDGRTGKEVYQEIKSSHPFIEIIIISNHDSGEVVLDLIITGVRNYIEKDDNIFSNLDAIIDEYLGILPNED